MYRSIRFNLFSYFRKEVTVGSIDRRQNFECDSDNTTCLNSTRYAIEETIVHELYTEGNVRNDLGLIRLKQEIQYNGEPTTI